MEEDLKEAEVSTEGQADVLSVDTMRMFENIALSKARIKNQQRDEEDLPLDRKIAILSETFQHSPAVFLERFHPYLCEDDLACFENETDTYKVTFYLKEARRRLAAGKADVVVKNRRYEALKRLEKEGSYFCDDEMRARDPLMYEQLIGQYLTDEEVAATWKKVDQTDLKFSTILLQFMEDQETKALKKRQQDLEDGAAEEEEVEEEEEDDTDEEDNSNILQDIASHSKTGKFQGNPSPRKETDDVDEEEEEEEEEMMDEEDTGASPSVPRQPTPATAEEKHLLREEFCSHMRERFLSGEDQDFDYKAVDSNTEYDSLAIRGWDEEEKYFDEEDPCYVEIDDSGNRKIGSNRENNEMRTDNEEVDDYETWIPPDDVADQADTDTTIETMQN